MDEYQEGSAAWQSGASCVMCLSFVFITYVQLKRLTNEQLKDKFRNIEEKRAREGV